MTLGTGVFLSSLFLGLIALFIATKDRWNWRKVVIWTAYIAAGLTVVGGTSLYGYFWYQERPQKQFTLANVPLGVSKAEVKFLRGEPSDKSDDDMWRYPGLNSSDSGIYFVGFREGNVRYVIYYGSRLYAPYIRGISAYKSLEELEDTYGKASFVSTSKDGLRRWYSFDKFNVAVMFAQMEIVAIGIYDSSYMPMRFKDEAN